MSLIDARIIMGTLDDGYISKGYPLLRIRMDGVPMRLVKEIVPKRETYVGRVLKGVKLSNRISKSWQRVG